MKKKGEPQSIELIWDTGVQEWQQPTHIIQAMDLMMYEKYSGPDDMIYNNKKWPPISSIII